MNRNANPDSPATATLPRFFDVDDLTSIFTEPCAFLMFLSANTPSPPCGMQDGATKRDGKTSLVLLTLPPIVRCILELGDGPARSQRMDTHAKGVHNTEQINAWDPDTSSKKE